MSIWSTLGSIGKVIASPIASIIGGLIGSSGQSSANESNLQAVRETNEQNYKIFQEQLGYNTEMWNQQNAYNTPLHQRQMYENAGVNPYFALGNIQSGQAQQVSAPSANPMQAALFENAAAPLGEGVAIAGREYVDSMIKKEQASGLNIENQMKAIDLKYHVQDKLLDLEQKRQNIENSKLSVREKNRQIALLNVQIASAKTELNFLEDYLSQRNESQRELTRKTKNEADEAYWKSDYARQISEKYPEMSDAQLRELSASAAAARASAEASRASAKHSNALTKTENDLRSGRLAAQELANRIQRGQAKLTELGVSKAELEDLFNKNMVRYKNGNIVFRSFDDACEWTTRKFGNVLGGIFK